MSQSQDAKPGSQQQEVRRGPGHPTGYLIWDDGKLMQQMEYEMSKWQGYWCRWKETGWEEVPTKKAPNDPSSRTARMNSRADRRRQARAEALRAGTATSEAQLRAARGSEASVPTIDEMRKDLEEAGWVQEYANVWKDKRGYYFRGPALAWHMMMMKPWPPNK